MVEARGLQKSLPATKIVYCTMEVSFFEWKFKMLKFSLYVHVACYDKSFVKK